MKIETRKPLFGNQRHKITDYTPLCKPAINLKRKELVKKIKIILLQIDGGGILGTMAVYNLWVLEYHYGEKLLRKMFRCLYGCSTGAIIVALYNLGWNFKMILQWYVEKSQDIAFKKHFLGDVPFIGSVYDSKPLEAELKKHFGEITFFGLFKKTNTFLNLSVVNITDNRQEYWNTETTPTHPVWVGVLASCATLWYHKRVKYKGKIYGDGGLGARTCTAEKAVMDALASGYSLRDILLMSFGCGRTNIKRPSWFWRLDKARYIMEFTRDETTAEQIRNISQLAKNWKVPLFYRDNPDLRSIKEKWAMDDTDKIDEMINHLEAKGTEHGPRKMYKT